MKKLFLFVAMAATVAFTSCSKDDNDTDAIVGTWVAETSVTPEGGETMTSASTWVFADDNTGVYTESRNGDQTLQSDFEWSKAESEYTLTSENAEVSAVFTIGDFLGESVLMSGDTIVAGKE